MSSVWENGGEAEKLLTLCGAELTENGFAIDFFNVPVVVDLKEGTVGTDAVKLGEKILILHYLTGPLENGGGTRGADSRGEDRRLSQPAAQAEDWVTFKQLPGASFYNSAYRKQGPDFVLHTFLTKPESLKKAGEKLGGGKGEYGDYSVIIRPFPFIRIMPVLYMGDDELPPEAEILFSGNITAFFTLEDVAVLARVTVGRLSKAVV